MGLVNGPRQAEAESGAADPRPQLFADPRGSHSARTAGCHGGDGPGGGRQLPEARPPRSGAHSLTSGGSVCLSWVRILRAAVSVPLSPSAVGLGVVQGAVCQAHVGAEGLPEPLAQERRLASGSRPVRKQGRAVRGRAGQGAATSWASAPKPPASRGTGRPFPSSLRPRPSGLLPVRAAPPWPPQAHPALHSPRGRSCVFIPPIPGGRLPVQLVPVEGRPLHSHREGPVPAGARAGSLQDTGLLEAAADVVRQL